VRRSRDAIARRRLTALTVAGSIALVVGIAIGASAGGGDDQDGAVATTPEQVAKQQARRLPLRRAVGAVLISAFDGPKAPEYIRRRLRAGETSGVILFAGNVPSRGGLIAMTRAMQRAAGGGAIVSVDQEGGEIRNLPWAGPAPGQPAQGNAANVRRLAETAGRQLRRAGVNVDLAPVADVPVGPTAVMAGRAFSGTTADVAAKVRASVEGLRAGGVSATAKHFPGLGAAATNTDDGSVRLDLLDNELQERDLPPFKAAIAAGVPLIMLSHALYPSLDPKAIASQSRPIVTGLLRERLGYDGVIVTDSIEAQAVLDGGGIATAAERSIAAGADLILMTGSGSWNQIYPRLLARAGRDAAFRARVRESAARILRLKQQLRRR
jgi:beta-N-acetylhexosaminidase